MSYSCNSYSTFVGAKLRKALSGPRDHRRYVQYRRFGPTPRSPRLRLDAASISGSSNGHQAEVCRALERTDPKFLRELADRIEDLDLDDVSYNVCLIMREHRDNVVSQTLNLDFAIYSRNHINSSSQQIELDRFFFCSQTFCERIEWPGSYLKCFVQRRFRR